MPDAPRMRPSGAIDVLADRLSLVEQRCHLCLELRPQLLGVRAGGLQPLSLKCGRARRLSVTIELRVEVSDPCGRLGDACGRLGKGALERLAPLPHFAQVGEAPLGVALRGLEAQAYHDGVSQRRFGLYLELPQPSLSVV